MHSQSGSRGFTLIEILIVVAIIAILASVVLVGLGPVEQSGRDARRISDLSEIQNGLELYFTKLGHYPIIDEGPWSAEMQLDLPSAKVGVTAVPGDPSKNRSYQYWYSPGGASYILGATLENPANAVFVSYTPLSVTGYTAVTGANEASIVPQDCAGSSTGNYCIEL